MLEAAEQLHYNVDKNASGLRRQRAKTLALLLFEEGAGDRGCSILSICRWLGRWCGVAPTVATTS